jgi:hypothetical protein
VDDDDRQAQRDQDAALELVRLEPREQQLEDHQSDRHGGDDRRRQRGPVEQAEDGEDEGHGEGAQHQQLAMGEIDDLHDAEDQRQADGDQGIEQAERDAVQRELKQVDRIDRHCGSGLGRRFGNIH